MPSRPPSHPLRAALADDREPLDWTTGIVTEVDLTSTPRTIRVRLADGTITDPITYLGWWAPRVDDTAELIVKGPKMMSLGAVAPANLDLPSPPPPIVAPAPEPAPEPPPTIRTVTVQPVDSAYWSPWGWREDDLIQGGPTNRAFWWYGDAIAAAKGAGTIVGGSVYVERRSTVHGVNGAARVRLGVHTQAGRGAGTTPHAGVDGAPGERAAATLLRGRGATVELSAAHLAQLNAGGLGFGLEPGSPSYESPDYLRAVRGGASGAVSLTIQD